MNRNSSFLLLGALLVGCFGIVSRPTFAGEPIRVLTYNIRYANPNDGDDVWENRKKTVVNTILESDVAGLQEVVASQHDFVQQNTPGWQWYGVGRDDGFRKGEMTSVGWRTDKLVALEQGTFWLSETPNRVGKAGWDASLPRIASWVRFVPRQGANVSAPPSLLFINTHFDHRGPEARRQSAAVIRNFIQDRRMNSQVVLVGDLNSQVGTPPLDELLAPGESAAISLLDARDHSEIPDTGPSSTWNGFRQIAKDSRIDHILFLGSRIQVRNYQTLDPRTPAGRFASDHQPILAIVEIDY